MAWLLRFPPAFPTSVNLSSIPRPPSAAFQLRPSTAPRPRPARRPLLRPPSFPPTTTPASNLAPSGRGPRFPPPGTFGSWTEISPATPGNLVGSIDTTQSHSGQYSLKLQTTGLAVETIGWEHRVRFEPGGRYEFSFWYYHLAQVRGTLSLRTQYPGTSIPLVIQMSTTQTGQWIQQKYSLTPSASFGTVAVTYQTTNAGVGADTIWIDDITVTRTA
jgi:hypothetical protein